MTNVTTKRSLMMALGGLIAATTMVSLAQADHNTRVSCYAYVHDQCYGGGANNCSGEDYNWGLDQCDIIYPSATPIRKPAVNSFKLPTKNNMQIRQTIKRTMR